MDTVIFLKSKNATEPRKVDGQIVTLTSQQLSRLLDGYDITRLKPHEN